MPAPGVSEAVLQQWNEIGRKLVAMAEDFPEAKHDFKPKPGARSFAERLIHAAAANCFFTNLVGRPEALLGRRAKARSI